MTKETSLLEVSLYYYLLNGGTTMEMNRENKNRGPQEGEKIVLLRNPLPLPRKKEHIRQDFDFPDPEWNTENPDLDYDLQTDDDDDFDL